MNKLELLNHEVPATPEKYSYSRYKELGGIINNSDYDRAFARLGTEVPDKYSVLQAETIARPAGIELKSSDGKPDKKISLFGILRNDKRPEGSYKRHHDEMSDQRIFMEVVRMLEDEDSIRKMKDRYSNIDFTYVEDVEETPDQKKAAA